MECPRCHSQQPDDTLQCSNCGALLDTGADALSVEETVTRCTREGLLAGRYRITNRLGAGGMGAVFLADDVSLGIPVAIKVLPGLLGSDERSINALRDEARIAISLTHPNIMRLHTFEDRDECKFLVMEYINGPNLDQVLAEQGKLSADEVVEIVRQACAGLEYAHSRRVVHRDIKPSNIMLDFPEESPYHPGRPLSAQMHFTVKITDFGIARQAKDSLSRVTKTESSGTLLYMSPEQLRGKDLDVRTDIYSLGATVYELLSGEPPFARGGIHFQILSEEPAPAAGVPEWLNAIVLKCLVKEPRGRVGSAHELRDMLLSDGVSEAAAWSEGAPHAEPSACCLHKAPVRIVGLVGAGAAAVILAARVGHHWWGTGVDAERVMPETPTVRNAGGREHLGGDDGESGQPAQVPYWQLWIEEDYLASLPEHEKEDLRRRVHRAMVSESGLVALYEVKDGRCTGRVMKYVAVYNDYAGFPEETWPEWLKEGLK